MRDWLLRKSFILHSGDATDCQIECDGLTNEEIETFALLIARKFTFGKVEGVPRGGWPIANALQKYRRRLADVRLLVDDVLTTGKSMDQMRENASDIGVVLFARGKCPEWIHPVFQIWGTVP
ncbi:MAG: phosphoribosyltransferase [Methylocella sp.]